MIDSNRHTRESATASMVAVAVVLLLALAAARQAGNAAEKPPPKAPVRIVRQAEAKSGGNVRVDTQNWGKGIGVIHTQGNSPTRQTPNFVEYALELSDAGTYQLNLRYASERSRPLRLKVGGQVVKQMVADESTGGATPDKQTWFAEAILRLSEGKNTIRLESLGEFPFLDKLSIASTDPPVAVEAESFKHGNVRVERGSQGRGVDVIQPGKDTPCFAQYSFNLPEAGTYQIDTRYAAGQSSPVTLSVNGRTFKRRACSKVTGSWLAGGQRWFAEGMFTFVKGANTIRLTSPRDLPNLDKLALSRVDLSEDVKLPSSASLREDAGNPWDLAARPRPFEETCFEDFRSASGGLTEQDAKRWLEPVEDNPLKLVESSNNYGYAVTMTGRARLRAPWQRDAVLRLSLCPTKQFKLHFWDGQQGCTLHYYRSSYWQSWVAYRTTRSPSEQVIVGGRRLAVADPGMAMLASDDRRSGRSLSGTYEIRHQDGTLMMTKGDVQLLAVPLAGLPTEVYFDGNSVLLRDIAMYRGGPAPDEPPPPRNVVIHGGRPASLPWRKSLPSGATFTRTTDGATELVAAPTDAPAWAWVPMIRPGLYEIILEVENPSPGTGVYLGDAEGRPVQGIEFFRNPRNGLTGFRYGKPGDAQTTTNLNADSAPAPYAGRRQWLRMVLAFGTLKCWTGSDGRHWGQVLDPLQKSGTYFNVGLFIQPGSKPRRIELRRLRVRELDALTSLAAIELQERAESLQLPSRIREITDLGAWQQWVWENQPPGVDPSAWRRACAVVTLIAATEPPLASAVLDNLLSEAIASRAPLKDKLRLLRDATLLYDTTAAADTARLVAHYERLGRSLLYDGDHRGFDVVRRALMTAPISVVSSSPQAEFDDLARAEILELAYRRQSPQVQQLCRQLRFWNQPASLTATWSANRVYLKNLLDWADARSRPGQRSIWGATARAHWRHPVAVQLGKEAYNVHADLAVALSQKDYRQACRILTSATVSAETDLLPDSKDPRLFGPLSTTVALCMRDHPALRQTMNRDFSAVGRLRLTQAMADGEVERVWRATVQYFGTPVAAEAHRWLGDRLLTRGQFVRAAGRYRLAMPSATATQRQQLDARQRLAAAMSGHRFGQPVTAPVRFGQVELSAEEFEQSVAAILAERSGEDSLRSMAEAAVSTGPAPAAARFELLPWGKLDGDVGTSPQSVPATSQGLDWPARQLAVAVENETMLVSNRFQVAAFDLAEGKPKWTCPLGEQQGSTHIWPLVPMRPLVAGNRVYVRRLPKHNRPELACLDLETGKLLWNSLYAGQVVSDPLFMDNHLFALVVDAAAEQTLPQLVLMEFDPDCGTPLSEKALLVLRTEWTLHNVCQVKLAGEKIVAAVAGAVLCCDSFGNINWVRQSTWVPPTLDKNATRQRQQPPLLSGGRVYVTQLGVRSVACVELQTGRIVWERALPGIRRMLGLVGQRLLVETDDGIRAFAAATGRTLWMHADADLLDGYLLGGPGGLLYTGRQFSSSQQYCPLLVWLDVETGKPLARCPLWSLGRKQPMFGPLVAHGGRYWCFADVVNQSGQLQPQREIMEMVAAGPPMPAATPASQSWTAGVDASLRAAADIVLPDWTLLAGLQDAKTGLKSELAGKQDVLVTKAAATAVRLARRVKLPAEEKPRLLIDIGHDAATQSKLEIRVAGMTALQYTPQPTTTAAQWQTPQVDLSAYAGREVWITIVQQSAGDNPAAAAYAYWKRLEIVP